MYFGKEKIQLEQYMVFTLPLLLLSKKEKPHTAACSMFDSWNQGSGTAFVMNESIFLTLNIN